MKLRPFQLVIPAFPALVLLLVSCASNPEDEKNVSASYREGVPGGTWVESYNIPVTVAAIDPATRKVTLTASDSSQNTFAAGNGFTNFDQLRVGDVLQATVARELVVFTSQHGPPPDTGTSATTALNKEGEQPGVLKADTVEKTAKVIAVNPNQRQATLQFSDGTSKELSVRRDVNLWKVKPGEEVVFRTTSAAVLSLEKP